MKKLNVNKIYEYEKIYECINKLRMDKRYEREKKKMPMKNMRMKRFINKCEKEES